MAIKVIADSIHAGFFIRSLAVLIDIFLLRLIFFLIVYFDNNFFFLLSNDWKDFYFLNFSDLAFPDIKTGLLVFQYYGFLDFVVYYFGFFKAVFIRSIPFIIVVFFWFMFSATPGKMIFRLKILDAKTGETPKRIQFVIRYFCYFLSGIFFLGFLWIIFDKKKQAFHDKIARTLVVRKVAKEIIFQPENNKTI